MRSPTGFSIDQSTAVTAAYLAVVLAMSACSMFNKKSEGALIGAGVRGEVGATEFNRVEVVIVTNAAARTSGY